MNNNHPKISPPNPPAAKGECHRCKTPLEMPFPPQQVFNAPYVSAMIIPHQEGINCPNCGLFHNLAIYPNASTICLAIVPVEQPQQEKPLIIPATLFPN